MLETCATWSMPMNASTSGRSLGNSPRNLCGKQPETINAWPRFCASRTCADSRIVSILSSWAASMNAHVLTITASALAASLTISRPSFSNEPSMISVSTRFLAQPSEIRPTRTGPSAVWPFFTRWQSYANGMRQSNHGKRLGGSERPGESPLKKLLLRLRRREGQCLARLFLRRLVQPRAEAAQRVFGLVDAPGAIAEDQHQQGQRKAERRQRHAPVDLRQLQHDHVEKTAGLITQRRRFVEFLRLIELRFEGGQQRRHLEPEQRAIRAHEPSNIDRRGKGGVVSFLKRADVVGLDLGDLGDLINGEALSLACRAELFGHCEHDRRFIAVLRDHWQSG